MSNLSLKRPLGELESEFILFDSHFLSKDPDLCAPFTYRRGVFLGDLLEAMLFNGI